MSAATAAVMSLFVTFNACMAGIGLCAGASVAPVPQKRATSAAIRDKSLVAWVRLDNLQQAGSGILAIQDGEEFDAVTFGERAPRRWMAGSHMFRRTQQAADQESLEPETADANQCVQIAIVYRGHYIEIWRDGVCYAVYQAPHQQVYSSDSDLYLGLRCIFGQKRYGFLEGAIEEARIYDVALGGKAIAELKPGVIADPKPLGCWTFETNADDVMENFPPTQLVGTARVAGGALLLDGRGFALISDRYVTEYRQTKVQAGFFTPPQRAGEMWDTWLYWHDGRYHMYYIAGPGGRWDAHEIAVSPDGVHWDYWGTAVTPREGTTWIGTGHVWKSPRFESDGRWILNYSEWFGDKQDIMVATSTDLLNWTKAGEAARFVQDTRWYKEKGRWDCIDVVEGNDGYLYGYFTADPDPRKVPYAHCGFGFARSEDGIRWEALPPVAGEMHGEFGGIQKLGERYYITMSEGRVGIGESPHGPFRRQGKNHNVFGGDIYFPRFFHTAPDGPLMNHFYKDGPVYAAPLKAVRVDPEGILRLVWWPGNNALKAVELPVEVCRGEGPVHWLAHRVDVNQTTVIEGTVTLPENGDARRGILFKSGDRIAEIIAFEKDRTHFGTVQLDSPAATMTVRQTADRCLDFGPRQAFRVLVNRDMLEVYVNDYLTILARVRNHGFLGLLSDAGPGSFEDLRMWRSVNDTEYASQSR